MFPSQQATPFFFFFFLLFFILVISCINWRNFNFFCCNKPMRRLFIVILKFPDLMLILLGTILFRLWLFFVVSPLGDCSLVGRTLGLQFVLAGLVSRLPKCRVWCRIEDCSRCHCFPKALYSEFGLMIQNYRTYYTQFCKFVSMLYLKIR